MHGKIFKIKLSLLQYTLSYCLKLATFWFWHCLQQAHEIHTYSHMLMQRLLIMTIYSYVMQSTFSAKQNSWTLLPKIDRFMIKDIIWCIIIRFAVFVALFSIWMWWSQKLGFIIKHAFKHGRCSLFMLELYCNHSFFTVLNYGPAPSRMLDSFI